MIWERGGGLEAKDGMASAGFWRGWAGIGVQGAVKDRKQGSGTVANGTAAASLTCTADGQPGEWSGMVWRVNQGDAEPRWSA